MPQVTTSNPSEMFSKEEWLELIKQMLLSPREGEIVRCLFHGLSDKQIASTLQIAIPTVRTHISRLFRKLNVSDREELILYIFRYFRDGCRKLNCPRKR